MEHKKTGSMQSHNHQNYTFKKSTHNWNGGTEVSSKANRMRHGSKGGGPMQLDPEPMFLQNNSKLDKLERTQQTAGSEIKEVSKSTNTEEDAIVAVATKFSTREEPSEKG